MTLNFPGTQQRILAALELETRQDLNELGREFAFLRNPSLPDSRASALEVAPGFAKLAHVTPLYLTTYLGKPGEDEPSIMASALNELFIPLLQEQFPEVVDFYLPPEACSYRVAIV